MVNKVIVYYGPKSEFKNFFPKDIKITTVSELAMYSDMKMREHTFKIQSRKQEDNALPEKKLFIPCLAAYSEEYAALTASAVNAFTGFVNQFDIDILCLQNPPMGIVRQFGGLNVEILEYRYEYAKINFDMLRQINSGFSSVITGQNGALRQLLRALYPLCSGTREKPVVMLFYGPTGVGKSETAKYLSDIIGQPLFRKQFSMFHSNDFTSYLFGGKHTESCLAKDLLDRESQIILFDEFDKPNPIFHSAFYQLFDEGIYEDKNYTADLRGSVIICTSNYASAEQAREKLGAPIFARFDSVIRFDALSDEAMNEILLRRCSEAFESLSENEKKLVSVNELYSGLKGKIYGTDGARGIERMVRDALSEKLLDYVLS